MGTNSGEKAAYRFFIQQSGTGEKVQNVGLRPLIISAMLDFGFTKGDAINLPDLKRVEVRVESEDPSKVQEFKEKLEKLVKTEAVGKYSTLPKDFKMTEVEEMKNPPAIVLPDLHIKANSMMLVQTSKGVGVMVRGFEGLREEFSDLANYFKKFIEGQK